MCGEFSCFLTSISKRILFVSALARVHKPHNRANDMHSHKLRRGRGTSQLALSACCQNVFWENWWKEWWPENRIMENGWSMSYLIKHPDFSLNIHGKENAELWIGVIICYMMETLLLSYRVISPYITLRVYIYTHSGNKIWFLNTNLYSWLLNGNLIQKILI